MTTILPDFESVNMLTYHSNFTIHYQFTAIIFKLQVEMVFIWHIINARKKQAIKKCQEQNYKEETNKNVENYVHLNDNGESSTDDDDSSSTIPYCIVADYDDGRNSDYSYESTDYARNKNVESKNKILLVRAMS